MPQIFVSLLLCRSSTQSFASQVIPRIFVIWFFGSRSTFRVSTERFYIYFMRLSYRSMQSRLGSDIRFYILVTLLCWNVSIFSFYSPSNSGMWLSYKESKFNFQIFVSRSLGRRQQTHTFGICGNYANIMLPDFQIFFNSPFFIKYLKRQSFSCNTMS